MTSFQVKDIHESVDALLSRLSSHVTRELQHQIIEIAGNIVGSLNFLGKPAGLYKNIGSGVEDFFYEV